MRATKRRVRRPNYIRRAINLIVAGLMLFQPAPGGILWKLDLVAWAAVPWMINYQGRITDTSNEPVTGTHTFVFRLYDDSASGSKQWEEEQTVSLSDSDNGVFSVVLGSVTPLGAVSFNAPLWLSVQVNDDPEMTPRQRLTATGYAMNADQIDSLDSTKMMRTDVDTSTAGKLTITRSGLALLIQPTTDPAPDTRLVDVQNAAGTSRFAVDLEGDVTVAGDLTVSGVIGGATSTTGTTNPSWNVGSTTDATANDMSLLLGQAAGQESLVFDGNGLDDFLMSDDLRLSAASALRLEDAAGGDYVGLVAPAAVTSYSMTLPAAVGAAGQALVAVDNAGTLGWTPTTAGTVTSISQGTGMSFSSDPITTTGTINLDTASTLTHSGAWTLSGDWVNTTNPWADNEVANDITLTSLTQITTRSFTALQATCADGEVVGGNAAGTGLECQTDVDTNSGGTVTSVGLSLPADLFSVANSPVTTAGTLTVSKVTQAANELLAGPVSGAAAAPAFRALVDDDVPNTITASNYLALAGGTMAGNIVMSDGVAIGQAAGPLLTFDDTNNFLELTSANLGIGTTSPAERLHVAGGIRLGVAPSAATLLNGGVNAVDNVVTVDDTTGYPAAGTLLIDTEAMTYTGTTATTFTGVVRGALGTTAAVHADNAPVGNYLIAAVASATDPKMVMTGAGNMGFGVMDPDEQLELSGRLHLNPVAAPVDTTGKLYNVAGALYWDGIDLTGFSTNPSFASISSGLNTGAGMIVGTGATLTAQGTGVIQATDLAAATSVVADAEVDNNLTVDWAGLQNYPAACGAGMVAQAVGDTLTCVADDDAPDSDAEVPNNITVTSAQAGSFKPTTDVTPMVLARGTDTAPAANLLTIRNFADTSDLFAVDSGGTLTAGTVPYSQVSGFTGDATPDSIADDGFIALGTETSGTYDATTDTIGDDGVISNAEVNDDITLTNLTQVTTRSFADLQATCADGQVVGGNAAGTGLECQTDQNSGGTVTAVSGTAPIASSGGTTPAISLNADGVTAAYLADNLDLAAAGETTLTVTGNAVVQSSTDSITGVQVLDADGGNPVLNVDTVNERVGIGTAAPSEKLHVAAGNIFLDNQQMVKFEQTQPGQLGASIYTDNGNSLNVQVDRANEAIEFNLNTTGNGVQTVMRVSGSSSGPADGGRVGIGLGTFSPVTKLDVFGSARVRGSATQVLTGSIDADGDTSVTGVGTMFTTQLAIGDRITVSGETRTVTAITDNNNLTVDTAFSNTANDTSPDRLPLEFHVRDSAGASNFLVQDTGNIGLGMTAPDEQLHMTGRLHMGQTAAPGDTTDKLYNVGGALYWDGIDLTGFSTNPSFASISSGVNNGAGMEVGTGASLYASGTGIVRATDLQAATSVVADAEVDDNLTIGNTGSVHWGALNTFPTACSAGQYVQAVGGTLVCVSDDDQPDSDAEVPNDITLASSNNASVSGPATAGNVLSATGTALTSGDLLHGIVPASGFTGSLLEITDDAGVPATLFNISNAGAITAGTIPWASVTTKPANLDLDSTDDLTTGTSFNGDVSGLYSNLQLGANVVDATELASTAIAEGDFGLGLASDVTLAGATTNHLLRHNGTAWVNVLQHAGSDLTADLEEETHAGEHDGTGLAATSDTLNFASTELNDLTWGNNTQNTIQHTYDVLTGTDPVVSYGNNLISTSNSVSLLGATTLLGDSSADAVVMDSEAALNDAVADSPVLRLRGSYDSDGSGATNALDRDATLVHNMTVAGPTPDSQLDLSIGSAMLASFRRAGADSSLLRLSADAVAANNELHDSASLVLRGTYDSDGTGGFATGNTDLALLHNVTSTGPASQLDVNFDGGAAEFSVDSAGAVSAGTWQAATVGVGYGGTGLTGALDDNLMVGNGTAWQSKGLPTTGTLGCSGANDKLLYNTTTNTFVCGADAGAGGLGDNVLVDSANVTDANFVDTAASGTVAGVDFALNTTANPDQVSATIGVASATEAGVVTTGIQTIAGSKTFSSALAANGGITFDNATDTVGGHRAAGTYDMNGNVVENIGNTGTDFIASTGGLTLAGQLTANDKVGIGVSNPVTRLDINGSAQVKGSATSVLTGTIDPDGDTSVTGVGTAFQSQLVVGDRITVTGETRTVTAIASDTSLTVDAAFADNANDASPDKLAAELIVRDASDSLDLIVQDSGNVGIGTGVPTALVHARAPAASNGTGNVSSTGVTVNGSGTGFLGQVRPGDIITASSQTRTVSTVDSDTSLTTTTAFSPALSGVAFTYQQPITRLADSSGVTQALVTAGGSVGIGTTAPNEKLTVEAPISIREQASSPVLTTNYGKIFAKNDSKLYFLNDNGVEYDLTAGSTGVAWSLLTNPTGSLNLSMGDNSTTLTYNGTTSTANLFNLTDTASNTGTGYMMNLTTQTGSSLKPLHVSAAGNEALTVLANGFVGMGVVDPDEQLEVAGRLHLGATSAPSTTAEKLYNVGGVLHWAGTVMDADSSNDLTTATTFAGDVGGAYNNLQLGTGVVGTTEVLDNNLDFADFTNSMQLDGSTSITTNSTEVLSIVNTGSANSFLVEDGTSDATPFVIDAAGDVGIGVASPLTRLHMYVGSTGETSQEMFRLSRDDTNSSGGTGIGAYMSATLETDNNGTLVEGGRIEYALDDGANNSRDASVRLYTLGPNALSTDNTPTEKMRISSAGNLGIGTTSPTAMVHAKGSLTSALTGTVTVGAGTASVTGSGTSFNTELAVGDSIKILGEIFTVQGIGGATALTLDSNHIAGAPGGTPAYRDPVLVQVDNGDAVTKLALDRSGRLGLGATPDEQLHMTGRVHLGQTTAPSSTTDKLYNVGGALYWDGIDLTGFSTNPSFASISSGVNTGAGMEVGSGASLYASGTGIVRATDLQAASSVVADAEVDNNITLDNLTQITTRPHSSLSGLTTGDDHTQYALLAGRAGGQTIRGDTGAGGDLTLDSTASGTKGDVLINPTGGNVGVGTVSPTYAMHVAPSAGVTAGQTLFVQDATATTGATQAVIKGGAGQAETAVLDVQGSSSASMFQVGAIGGAHVVTFNQHRAFTGQGVDLRGNEGNSSDASVAIDDIAVRGNTSGNAEMLAIAGSFGPGSGAGTFSSVESVPIINQSGTATGASRGLYLNPTVTSAADFRALEVAGYTHNILGTPAALNGSVLNAPTLAKATAHTVTNAANLHLSGAPSAGGAGPVTVTNAAALRVAAGAVANTTNAYGLYVDAPTGATNNYAAVFPTGNIGLGLTDPDEQLELTGRVHLGQTSAPGTTTDKLYNVGGTLYWNGADISSVPAADTLQSAYGAGNAITTTDNRNLAFTLDDTTTDSDFLVNMVGTGNVFEIQDGGTMVTRIADNGVTTFQTKTDSATGFQVLDANGGNPVLDIDTANERVGIGTASPSLPLDVNGPANIGDYLQVGSDLYMNDGTEIVFTGVNAVGTIHTNGTGGTLEVGNATDTIVMNDKVGIGTATPVTKLDVAGSTRVKGTATSVLTGSIDPAASTTVTGVGTAFQSELVVGDRITVTGETRTVTAIASNTSLTIDSAFTDNANDTSPDKLAAELIVKDAADAVDFIVKDNGNVGIGTASPTNTLQVAGTTALLESATDFRLNLSKNAPANTASMIFQDNYSARAEIGLLGNDKLGIKVTPDGSAWVDGITIDQTNGNVALGTVATADEQLHMTGRLHMGQTTAPSTTTDKLYNVGGTLYWAGNALTTAAGSTLQAAYASGNTITTTDGRNLAFTLDDTTTDSDFLVNMVGTGNVFEVQDAGTMVARIADNGVTTFQTKTDSATGFQVLDANGGNPVLNVDTASERVGIGTSAPGEDLDVAGVIRAFGTTGNEGLWVHNSSAGTNTFIANTQGTAQISAVNGFGNGGTLTITGNGTKSGGTYLDIIDGSGSTWVTVDVAGRMGLGTATPRTKLDVAGSARVKGTAASVLTGSIDPTASTTVTGVGTAFQTELVVGDRITVTGETRTVTAIASNTSLTVSAAFTDGANDTSVDRMPAAFVVQDSSNALMSSVASNGVFGTLSTLSDPTSTEYGLLSFATAPAAIASPHSKVGAGLLAYSSHTSGTIYSLVGATAGATKASTGSLTSAAGLTVQVSNSNATGTITDAYGIYIGDSGETGAITNDWGLYQVDTGAWNFFGGNVGIGSVTQPDESLHTSGRLHMGQTTAPSTTTDKLYNVAGNLFWNGAQLATGSSSPWQTTSNVANLLTGTDNVTVGSASNLGKLAVDGDTDEIQLLVQGHSTQTSPLLTLETSGGTDMMTVSNAGDVLTGAQSDVRFQDDTGGQYVALQAPTGVTTHTLTLPAALPGSTSFLKSSNTGAMSWDTGTYLSSETGDVSAVGNCAGPGACFDGVSDSTGTTLTFSASGGGETDPTIASTSTGNLVLSAPTGIVQVGNASGDILMSLTNATDDFLADKTVALAGAYSGTDFTFTRTLTGAVNKTGAVLSVIDTSTSGTIAPDMLLVNAASGSTGNLMKLQLNGGDRFLVDASGNTLLKGQADLRLEDDTGGEYIAMQAAAGTTTHTMTWPTNNGSGVLTNNGSGGLSWAAAASGDNLQVNGTNVATTGNIINTAASGTMPSVTWALTGGSPDSINISAIGAASATEAGVVTTGTQTIAGDKTLTGTLTFSGVTNDIRTATNEHLTIAPGGAGDIQLDVDADTDLVIPSGQTLRITDGTNLLMSVADSGTSGLVTATNYFQTGNISYSPTGVMAFANSTGIGINLGTQNTTLLADTTGDVVYISGQLTEAGSGTHSILTGLNIAVPTITNAAAAVTDASTAYIQGQTTATGANNHALWVDAGKTRLDGDLDVAGTVTYTGATKPKRTIILTAGGAIAGPNSTFADQQRTDGTNVSYYTLNYDSGADEKAFWEFVVPDSYTGSTAAVTIYWLYTGSNCSAGSCEAQWNVEMDGKPIGVAFDSALQTAAIDTSSAGNAGMLVATAIMPVTTGWAPGEVGGIL